MGAQAVSPRRVRRLGGRAFGIASSRCDGAVDLAFVTRSSGSGDLEKTDIGDGQDPQRVTVSDTRLGRYLCREPISVSLPDRYRVQPARQASQAEETALRQSGDSPFSLGGGRIKFWRDAQREPDRAHLLHRQHEAIARGCLSRPRRPRTFPAEFRARSERTQRSKAATSVLNRRVRAF